MSKVSCALAVAVILSACQSVPEAPACPSDNVDFAALFDARYTQPFRDGDAALWADVFAHDAVALHNRRSEDIGKDKIQAFGELVAGTFELAKYDVAVTDTRKGCDWALSYGRYQSAFIFRETGEPAPWGPESGKFMVVWEYNEPEGWKIVADMGNSLQ